MKRIVTYKLFESGVSGLSQEQEDFLNEYTKGSWKHDPSTGLVDIEGDFRCWSILLEDLKGIKFGKVSGDFEIPFNSLKSLDGSPQEVGGNFKCINNDLTSLKGAPQRVGGYFGCSDNQLTSLKGAPQRVGGVFGCSGNKLNTLQGAPQEVGGDFLCYSNPLTSLIGAPRRLSGAFYCDAFQLGSGKWNPKGWLEILKEPDGTPKAQSLVLTLISPEVLNREIQKDPGGMLMVLKPVWNDPNFENIKKDLEFPGGIGDADKTIKSLKKLDDIKDLI